MAATRRRAPPVRSRAFIAARTGEMEEPPLWQAEPAEAARESASAARSLLADT